MWERDARFVTGGRKLEDVNIVNAIYEMIWNCII